MFKFGHIDIEKSCKSPVFWDKISKDDFNLLMKCKNLYELCLAYSGHNVHDVNGAAKNLLNGAKNFLYSFTKDFIDMKDDIDVPKYIRKGGWEYYTRNFLVYYAVPRSLKAFAEK